MDLERLILREVLWSCYYKREICFIRIRSLELGSAVDTEVVSVQAAAGCLRGKRCLPVSFTELEHFFVFLNVLCFKKCKCFAIIFISACCKVRQLDLNWLEKHDWWDCTKPHVGRNWSVIIRIFKWTKWAIRTNSKFDCDMSGFWYSSLRDD